MAGRRKLLLERFPATTEQRPLYQLCVSHFRNGRSDFTPKKTEAAHFGKMRPRCTNPGASARVTNLQQSGQDFTGRAGDAGWAHAGPV